MGQPVVQFALISKDSKIKSETLVVHAFKPWLQQNFSDLCELFDEQVVGGLLLVLFSPSHALLLIMSQLKIFKN
jgi:hypothetical protein